MRRCWSGAFLCGVAIAVGAVSPASAFWPFTRSKPAVPDSVSGREWSRRFLDWKARPLPAATPADTAATSGPVVPDASAAPASPKSARTGGGTRIESEFPAAPPDSIPMTVAADSLGAPTESDLVALARQAAQAAAKAANAAARDSVQASSSQTLSNPSQPQQTNLADKGFAPSFSSRLSSTNDLMTLNMSLSNSFLDPSGVTLNSTMGYGEEVSFTQNTGRKSRSMSNTFTLPLRDLGLAFSLSTGNDRTDSETQTVNQLTQTASEVRRATIGGSVSRSLISGITASANYSHDFSRNDQDIVASQGTSSGARGSEISGDSYGFGASMNRLKWLRVQGRFGRSLSDNVDRSPSFADSTDSLGEKNSTSDGDTASVSVNLNLPAMFPTLSVTFRTSSGQRSYSDVTRTSVGGAGSVTEFALETESRFSRSLQLSSSFKPWSGLSLDLGATIGRDSTSYVVRPNSFSDTQRRQYSLRSSLKYMAKGTLAINYETSTADVDRDEPSNPRNAQTKRDEDTRITAEIQHEFTKTFKVRAYGERRLGQAFHKHTGPQGLGDRDELRQNLGMRVEGRMSAKISGSAEAYVRSVDQAFIDPRRSASSRDETEYVVKQDFRYQVTPNVSLTQLYQLSSKVIDEIYDPNTRLAPGKSTLNRNHFMKTGWNYRVTPRLAFEGNLDYLLQDNGAYLPDPLSTSQERFFSPTVETKKNAMWVSMSYNLLSGGRLTLTSRQDTSREWRSTFSRGRRMSVNVVDRKNLALGLSSSLKVGELELRTQVARNQSFNATLNRNVFYNVDATLSYTF